MKTADSKTKGTVGGGQRGTKQGQGTQARQQSAKSQEPNKNLNDTTNNSIGPDGKTLVSQPSMIGLGLG